MRTRAAALLTVAALAALLALPATAGALQISLVGDFQQPTTITSPPGDVHRLFVAQKMGAIELLHDGERKQFFAFDPSEIQVVGESGLLSMAFAPDYATSGRFYLYYSAPPPPEGTPDGNVGTLVEYRRSATDPDVADPATRRVLLTVDHLDSPNHNGGELQFGPDGLLYLSTGDGGGPNDPGDDAQNPASPLGKMFRIDPRDPNAVPGLVAIGLRNPWRFSFDRLTGDQVIADVGQSHREEIDFAPKGTADGVNYGWRCMEGNLVNVDVDPQCTPSPPYVGPVFEYDHEGGRCAITGGYVVRTHELEAVYGRYVYADWCSGDLRSVSLAAAGATGDAPTGAELKDVYTFGEDACANVYLGTGNGNVWELMADGIEAPAPCTTPWAPPSKPPTKPPTKPPPKDRTPPVLTIKRAFRQSLGELRSLFVRVRCSERCAVAASARVSVPGLGRQLKIPRLTRTLDAEKSHRFRLLLNARQAGHVRDALRAGQKVRATLRIAARDAPGNETVKTKPVLLGL